jgi:excinuclease ABC subunit B
MYRGDRARKTTLVQHGFRLPSALDNRPLRFEEFLTRVRQMVCVSATPGPWELERTGGAVVEQIIRPTGLVDPALEVRPARGQIDDLLGEIRARVERGERVLVTTLTKRMAEELTEYYAGLGVKVRYMHADVETLERSALLRDLRLGTFDVLVGINLLREGLDLPEVSLVAILDADKEGFLRSTRSLIQTVGRAARNVGGRVILYADQETDSIRRTLEETERRRARQEAYNTEHGITPESVVKRLSEGLDAIYEADYSTPETGDRAGEAPGELTPEDLEAIPGRIEALTAEMHAAARELAFERAAELRDEIARLEALALRFG